MRHFTIDDENGQVIKIKVPSNWVDLTLRQYIQMLSEPDTEVLRILTDLTVEQIKVLTGPTGLVLDALKFLEDTSILAELQPSPELPEIGSSTYGQLMLAMQYIEARAQQPAMSYAPYLYALYQGQQIKKDISERKINAIIEAVLNAPLTEVYADMLFYINDLAEFHNRHADEESDNDEYTDEEYEAGIEEIGSRFGPFATLDSLSGGDVTKYQQVLDMDAETVMQKIRLMQLQNRIQKNIQKIYATKTA